MRNALLGALLLLGCGGPFAPCPMIDCANVTHLTVTDSAGNPVNDVSGFVTVGSEQFTVGCGSAQPPDAGSPTTADGGFVFVGQATCEGNKLRFVGGNFREDVRADLKSGNRSFNGVVTVVQTSNPVGSGACQTSCGGQEGTVILQ